MTSKKAILGRNGRLAVPAFYRKILGLKTGDELILVLEGREIRLIPQQNAVQYAPKLVRQYIPRDLRLSEELIQERRDEAGND
jgi:AbrB family looped-hinge helix DNA binding protein